MKYLALLAFFWAPSAVAGTSELSFELGNLSNPDPMYDLFSDWNDTPSQGFRVGISARDRLSVIGGWHQANRGARVYTYYGDTAYADEPDYYYEEGDTYVVNTALQLNQYQAGLKSELKIWNWLYPYFTGQALIVHGTVRIDDDTSTRNNPGQIRKDSLGVGALGTIGLDFRLPQKMLPLTLGWHVEGGYALVSPMGYGDLGKMSPRGVVIRSGIGIRF